MITINCGQDDVTEIITAPIDILKKSSLFDSMYKDTHESTTWDLTNNQLIPVYLKNVIKLMENPDMEINSDIKSIKCFIEFLNCADSLLLDDDTSKIVHRLIDDQVKLLNNEKLLTIVLHLNEGVKCSYIDILTNLLLKLHADELIEFVKNNKFNDYTSVYINDIQITQNMFDSMLKLYCDCCFDKLSQKLSNQNVNLIHQKMVEVINGRKGMLDELRVVY